MSTNVDPAAEAGDTFNALTLVFHDKRSEEEYLRAHDASMMTTSRIYCAPLFVTFAHLVLFLSIILPARDQNYFMTGAMCLTPLCLTGIVLKRKYNGRGFITFLRILQGYTSVLFIWIAGSPLLTVLLGRCFIGQEIADDVITPVNCPLIRIGVAPVSNVMAICMLPLFLTTMLGMQVMLLTRASSRLRTD